MSDEILGRLEESPLFQSAHTILLYHSLPDEVHTHQFIDRWSKEKQILLPVIVGGDLELRHYAGAKDMSLNTYGISEPCGMRFTAYNEIDLAIIPGMAFDSKGNRLGRGKGFYDKLLPHIQAPKVGICFDFQLLDEVPAETFDVKMDHVISTR